MKPEKRRAAKLQTKSAIPEPAPSAPKPVPPKERIKQITEELEFLDQEMSYLQQKVKEEEIIKSKKVTKSIIKEFETLWKDIRTISVEKKFSIDVELTDISQYFIEFTENPDYFNTEHRDSTMKVRIKTRGLKLNKYDIANLEMSLREYFYDNNTIEDWIFNSKKAIKLDQDVKDFMSKHQLTESEFIQVVKESKYNILNDKSKTLEP